MIPFKEFATLNNQIILEGNHAIKSHISHLEDLAIEYGKEGFSNFATHVSAILNRLQGFETDQQVNLKVDGSMMVLFGTDPRKQFKGQFFVSTKSGMSNNPKLNHSYAEIDQNYPDPDLNDKLKQIYQQLKPVYEYESSGNIYQCDILFCRDGDKKFFNIEGQRYLTFTPNTITYAIPVDKNSELYNRINSAKLGAVVHEVLKAVSINKGTAIELRAKTRNVDRIVLASRMVNVFLIGSNYKGLKFQVDENMVKQITTLLALCNNLNRTIPTRFNNNYVSAPIIEFLKRYLNKQIEFSNGGLFGAAVRKENFSFKTFRQGFRKYLDEFHDKEAEARKTPRGIEGVRSRQQILIDWLNTNEPYLHNILHLTYLMIQIKLLILQLFKQIESKLGKTFIQEPDGSFRSTSDEGFVCFIGSSHIKLVDRLDFTKVNRMSNRRFK